jgi:hypothetical protein
MTLVRSAQPDPPPALSVPPLERGGEPPIDSLPPLSTIALVPPVPSIEAPVPPAAGPPPLLPPTTSLPPIVESCGLSDSTELLSPEQLAQSAVRDSTAYAPLRTQLGGVG